MEGADYGGVHWQHNTHSRDGRPRARLWLLKGRRTHLFYPLCHANPSIKQTLSFLKLIWWRNWKIKIEIEKSTQTLWTWHHLKSTLRQYFSPVCIVLTFHQLLHPYRGIILYYLFWNAAEPSGGQAADSPVCLRKNKQAAASFDCTVVIQVRQAFKPMDQWTQSIVFSFSRKYFAVSFCMYLPLLSGK